MGLVALLIGAAAMQSFTGPGNRSRVPRDRSLPTANGSTSSGAGLDPGLRLLSRAQDQGARGHRDPRDLRPHRLGANGGRPWQGRIRGDPADLLSSKYGITPADPDSGRKLIGQLEPKRITDDLNAVYAYVNGLPSVAQDQIGTIGFCWGGGQSFRYATNNPKLRAAVVAYGPAPDTADLKKIQAPVLGIYGENDERINASLPMVTAEMQSAGKDLHLRGVSRHRTRLPEAGRQGSNGPQVEKAWARILEFYRVGK